MQICVKIHKKYENKGPLKAIASVTFDNEFTVHNVKLIETKNGRFACMPNKLRKNKDGKIVKCDVFHPISSSARITIEDALFNAYEKSLKDNT